MTQFAADEVMAAATAPVSLHGLWLSEAVKAAVAGSMPLPKARRGRPPKLREPRLVPRVRSAAAEPMLYIADTGIEPFSTGYRTSQRAEAQSVLAAYKVVKAAAAKGAVAPLSIAVSAVTAHAIQAFRPKSAERPLVYPGDGEGKRIRKAWTRYRNLVRELDHANRHFADTPLYELTETTLREFEALRMEHDNATFAEGNPDVRKVGRGGARMTLLALRKAVKRFFLDKRLPNCPTIWVPPNGEHRTRFLTRRECARLLGACLGFVWDTVNECWSRETASDANGHGVSRLVRRPPEVRATRRALARLILISLYTGTRSGVVRELRWTLNDEVGAIDIESGMLHRQGLGRAPQRGKKKPSCNPPARLLAHCRRWRNRDDELGTDFVLHKSDGSPFWHRLVHQWESVREDAGLGHDREVIPHALRHTCATWLRLMGVRLEEAAEYLGLDPVTLLKVYGQKSIDGHHAATAAMDKASWLQNLRVMGGRPGGRKGAGPKARKGPAPKPVWTGPETGMICPTARVALDFRPGRELRLVA